MSYVQGTKIRIKGTFIDPDTQDKQNPSDVVVIISMPDGTTETRKFSDGADSLIDNPSVGVFQTIVDTGAMPGKWEYSMAGTGPLGVVKRDTLRVRPEIATS